MNNDYIVSIILAIFTGIVTYFVTKYIESEKYKTSLTEQVLQKVYVPIQKTLKGQNDLIPFRQGFTIEEFEKIKEIVYLNEHLIDDELLNMIEHIEEDFQLLKSTNIYFPLDSNLESYLNEVFIYYLDDNEEFQPHYVGELVSNEYDKKLQLRDIINEQVSKLKKYVIKKVKVGIPNRLKLIYQEENKVLRLQAKNILEDGELQTVEKLCFSEYYQRINS